MRYFSVFIFFLLFCSCKPAQPSIHKIKASDPKARYIGRVVKGDSAVTFFWSGSEVIVKFLGSRLDVLMDDHEGRNYYQIIVDDDSSYVFHPQRDKHWYTIASDLGHSEHTVRIFKRTEYVYGKTIFYSFSTDEHGQFYAFLAKSRLKIEFYGNSVTAGLANEHPAGASMEPKYENNYMAYGALAARELGADYICISRSGIGLTVSWDSLIMPELFWRIDPGNSHLHWDFGKIQPDIVVINLFQNDSWLVKRANNGQYKRRFGQQVHNDSFFIQSYYNFVDTLLRVYPKAQIICTLGPMSAVADGSKWKRYIEQAVRELNDPRVHVFFFPYFVHHGHPRVADHQKMARLLVEYIREQRLAK